MTSVAPALIVPDRPCLFFSLSAICQPARSIALGEALRMVTVSCSGAGPDRIHQGADDADRVIGLARARLRPRAGVRRVRTGMARCVVRVPGLRLKRQEDGHPLLSRGKVQNETAILPHAIIAEKRSHVALVHMDVMNPSPGRKFEYLVPRLWFWPPALPEGIDHATLPE